MDAEYARHYRTLHERHWWWRTRAEYVLSWLDSMCPSGGLGPILDVGCGEALWFDELTRYGEPEGVENDHSLVAAGRQRGAHIWEGVLDDSFQPGHEYGLVMMLDTLEHIPDDVTAFGRASSLLAPGGFLLVTVPAFGWLWTTHDDLNHHIRRYHVRELLALARRANVEVVDSGYFFHWLVVPKLATRMREALFPRPPSVPAVPSATVNDALITLGRLERSLCSPLRLPFGGSAFLIARRPR